jgi:hypothetical protein
MPTLSRVTKLYSVQDAKISPLLTDPAGGTATYGTIIDVPGIQTMEISGSIEVKKLRGDNGPLATNSHHRHQVQVTHAKLSLDVLARSSAAPSPTPAPPRRRSRVGPDPATATLPPFKLEGITPPNGVDIIGGDLHWVLYKCTLTAFPDLGFARRTTASGFTAGCDPLLSTGKWIDAVLNETAFRSPDPVPGVSLSAPGTAPPLHPQAETRHSPGDPMTTGLDLLAEGGSIDLTDGTTVQLRYSFRALAPCEARFGSIAAVQTAIDETGNGAAFGPLVQIIGAGCIGPGGFEPHFREHVDAAGKRSMAGDIVYRRRTDGADLAEMLHPGRLGDYVLAFTTALSAALTSPGNDGAPAVETVPATLLNSPGMTSSTSLSVPSTFDPSRFWDLTLRQLMTLADRHRLATASSSTPHTETPPTSGIGVLGMAAIGRV